MLNGSFIYLKPSAMTHIIFSYLESRHYCKTKIVQILDLVKFVMCDLVSRELKEQEGNNFVKQFSLTLGYINCTLRKGTVFVPLYEG